MKIATFNANGIRAASKREFWDWFRKMDIDILGIQETKIQEDQINPMEYELMGYNSFWHSAEKKGYSSVGILSRKEPVNVVKGIGVEIIDREGRVIRTDYEGFSVVNVYIPSGTSGDHRHQYKMEFLRDFRLYLDELKKEQENLIVIGDYNIVHTGLDIHNPDRKDNPSGYRPDERAWLTDLYNSGFNDSFRLVYPEEVLFSWWSYRGGSRQRNKGWRIDYISVTDSLKDKVKDVKVYKDPVYSDHCPVVLEIDL